MPTNAIYQRTRKERVTSESPAKQVAGVDYTRTKSKKRRFGNNETVSAAVAERTRKRAERLGFPAGTHSGKVTGFEARAVRKALRKQKASRARKLISGSTPRSAS